MPNQNRVLLAAGLCAALGLIFYHLQDHAAPTMNLWGIVAFGAVGASLGCLAGDEQQSGPFDSWGNWW